MTPVAIAIAIVANQHLGFVRSRTNEDVMRRKVTLGKNAEPMRALYALGAKVLAAMGAARRGKRTRYAPGVIADYAKRLKMPASSLYKAVQYAEVYTAKEMEELCTLNRRGTGLGIGHLYELLQVPKRSMRQKLQHLAAEQRWSVRRLKAERHKRLGVRKSHMVGRPPKLAKDLKGLLDQLQSESWRWKRWLAAFTSRLEQFEGLPDSRKLARLLQRQQSAIEDLQKLLLVDEA